MIRKELVGFVLGIGVCLAVPAWPEGAPADSRPLPEASTLGGRHDGEHAAAACPAQVQLEPAADPLELDSARSGAPFRF